MIEFMKEVFLQNAFSSLKISAVIVLLFVLTKPITKRYTAGFRYYSWLAVMLIFLIPFSALGADYTIAVSPSVTSGIHSMRNWYEDNAPEYSVTETYTDYEIEEINDEPEESPTMVQVTKTTTEKKQVEVTAVFALIWLIGALAYFALHYGRYIYFRRGLKRLSNVTDEERICGCLDSERERLEISRSIKIRHFSLVDTPMLVGILQPEIILPRLDYTDDELRLIFRHELVHFKRKDILYQLITLIFVSLHWFNPFVYLMAKAIETDGETSCDEKTLEGRAYEEKLFYGEMLIKFLKTQTQKRSYMTTTFFGGKKAMKKRLTLIADKSARRRGTAAMAAVMITAAVTSVCAAAMDNEYFNSVFEGDTSYLADFVKTEKKSVEDDRFKLTLEQYLISENHAMIMYSFEAKTADAVEELNSGHFWDMDTISFYPTDYKRASCQGGGGYGNGDFAKKHNTENKIYCIFASDSIENEEKIDFCLTTNKIKGSPKIIVPMDYNMETTTVVCDDITVKYNPISISATYSTIDDDCDNCEWNGTYFYFRMKNGDIKTFSQLYNISGGFSEFDENGNYIWTERAWAKEIIRPGEIQSVIVNDTEYPVDNPSDSKPCKIDDIMKPFMMSAYIKEHLWIPVRELCGGLGAEIVWDDGTQSATVKYRGSEYVFTVGKNSFLKDGEEITFYNKAPFIDENGRMIVPPRIAVAMEIDIHGRFVYDENDNLTADTKWHVFP